MPSTITLVAATLLATRATPSTLKTSYQVTTSAASPPRRSCTDLCQSPAPLVQTTTEAEAIQISAAAWFALSPGAEVAAITPTIVDETAGVCAEADLRAKTVTFACAGALAELYARVAADIPVDPKCACNDPTALCVAEPPWPGEPSDRCIVIPDNTTTASLLCYGPCDEVGYSLAVAAGVVFVAAVTARQTRA